MCGRCTTEWTEVPTGMVDANGLLSSCPNCPGEEPQLDGMIAEQRVRRDEQARVLDGMAAERAQEMAGICQRCGTDYGPAMGAVLSCPMPDCDPPTVPY